MSSMNRKGIGFRNVKAALRLVAEGQGLTPDPALYDECVRLLSLPLSQLWHEECIVQKSTPEYNWVRRDFSMVPAMLC